MSSQTSHHPQDSLLREFNAGTLAPGMSVAVSAHLEFCDACREASNRHCEELAREWLTGNESYRTPDYISSANTLDGITSKPQLSGDEGAGKDRALANGAELHMHERSVRLPKVLARLANRGVVWRKLAGGINSASLKVDNKSQCDFMYMKPGSQAPRHTHSGIEITLVLDGMFADELGEYRPGDFVMREGSHVHTPRSDEGCLCYSVLDSPLKFRSGWVRLLNPFQGFLFRRQLRS